MYKHRRRTVGAQELFRGDYLPEICFVDIDGTLLSVSSEKLFLVHLVRTGTLRKLDLLRFMGQYPLHPVSTLRQGKGWNRTYLRSLPPEKISKEGIEFGELLIRSKCRQAILELLTELKERGSLIVLVSATLGYIAQGIAAQLPVDIIRASEPEISGGKYTGKLTAMRPWGRNKVRILNEICTSTGVTPQGCLALGDSWSDRHIMSECGTAVAVCPDGRLRRMAMRNRWGIMEGQHTRWA